MKTMNSKLIVLGLASALFAACSDNAGDGSTTDLNPEVVGVNVNSVTDAETLAKSVLNFKSVNSGMLKAAGATDANLGDVYSMPAKPSVPAGAEEITNKSSYTETQGLDGSKTYVIKSGTTITSGVNLNGATLYIEKGATLNTKNIWGCSGSKIYNLGGTVTLNNEHRDGGMFDNAGLSFYNYGGTVTINDKSHDVVRIGKDCAFYTDCDFDTDGKPLIVEGKLYAGGKVTVGGFEPIKDSWVNIQGGIAGLDGKNVKIDGTVNIDGNLKVNNLEIVNEGKFWLCSAEVTNNFTINGNGSESHISYIKADKILHHAASKIYLVDNSVIECNTYENKYNNQGADVILQGDYAKAYFKAGTIQFNEGSKGGENLYNLHAFNAEGTGGIIYVDADKYIYFSNQAMIELDAASQVVLKGSNAEKKSLTSDKLKLDKTDVACGYHIVPDNSGDSGKTDPDEPTPTPGDKGKYLDEISNIDYNHDHDISATCIQPYNGKMYMSYHTRGGLQGGCIEVFKTENNKTTLLQYIEDIDHNYDYNHLMVDPTDKKVYVVGNSSKKGAMLGRIDILDNGLLNADEHTSQTEEGATVVMPLEILPYDKNAQKYDKNDENCIIRDNDRLFVTTTKGLVSYEPSKLDKIEDVELAGKAKHIAVSGDKIITLNYTTRPSDENATVTGEIREFTAGGKDKSSLASPNTVYTVGDISPNNGKNTIAIDGTKTYVCRSAEGLSCYENGKEVWNWTAPLTQNTKKVKGYANGVTFDNDYIYLACGGYGLVVLDKNNLENGKPKVVAHKTCATKNSANYVTLDNGYIYVAYGQSRLRVFKLIDKK